MPSSLWCNSRWRCARAHKPACAHALSPRRARMHSTYTHTLPCPDPKAYTLHSKRVRSSASGGLSLSLSLVLARARARTRTRTRSLCVCKRILFICMYLAHLVNRGDLDIKARTSSRSVRGLAARRLDKLGEGCHLGLGFRV